MDEKKIKRINELYHKSKGEGLTQEELAEQKGPQHLHDMLRKIDPVSAEAIHPNNRKRVIRALEFFHLTG